MNSIVRYWFFVLEFGEQESETDTEITCVFFCCSWVDLNSGKLNSSFTETQFVNRSVIRIDSVEYA